MHEFIKDYVRTYGTCIYNKAKRHQPYRLLKQLPIPSQLWKFISMDFIEQLPEFQGFTDISVVVDCLTKQAIFISTKRLINTAKLAKVFIRDIFFKHGTLAHITSDWGSEFVFCFFKALSWYKSLFYLRLSLQGWWLDWADKSNSWTVSENILQLSVVRLGIVTTINRVHL